MAQDNSLPIPNSIFDEQNTSNSLIESSNTKSRMENSILSQQT